MSGQEQFGRLTDGCVNFVLIGESGCGKSEIALSLASKLAKNHETELFDLDQTKALYRSRDALVFAGRENFSIHCARQFYDTPTIAGGVKASLLKKDKCTVVDVGGNDTGARMIGQFAAAINNEYTRVFFVVNPYRPWSGKAPDIAETMDSILNASHIESISILANPNIGAGTTADDFIKGYKRLELMTRKSVKIEGACVQQSLYEEVKDMVQVPLLPIELNLVYE